MEQTAQVGILMATYNGEQYLSAQLDSIIGQEYTNWILLISDDGSTDGTKEILTDYQRRFPDKIRILEKEKASGSAKCNFMFLTRQAEEYPYLMYCDQDDFWKPEKIRVTLEKMKDMENGDASVPCLVHSDLEVVDQNLNPLSSSFFRFSGLSAERSALNQLLIQNIVTGCTMMINHALWKLAVLATDEENILMHDWWFALIAGAVGKIGFVSRPLILYRQHGNNSVGAKNAKDPGYISAQIKKGNKNRVSIENTMRQAKAFSDIYSTKLDEHARRLINAYASLLEKGKGERIKVIWKNSIWKKGVLRKAAQIIYL